MTDNAERVVCELTARIPQNDPSVHLVRSRQIIIDQRVSYSEIAWYPPFFHSIVALMQIFAGTTDVMVAAFILKILIGTFNILSLLSSLSGTQPVYLLRIVFILILLIIVVNYLIL